MLITYNKLSSNQSPNVAGDDPHQAARSVYKTCVTVYLVLGLVAVMTMVNIVTNIPELDITGWFRYQDKQVHN